MTERDVLCEQHEHAREPLGNAWVDTRGESEFIVEFDQLDSLFPRGIEFQGEPAAKFSGPMDGTGSEVAGLDSNVEMFENYSEVLLSQIVILDGIRKGLEVRKGARSVSLELGVEIGSVVGVQTWKAAGRGGSRDL